MLGKFGIHNLLRFLGLMFYFLFLPFGEVRRGFSILIILTIFIYTSAYSQFAPAAGEPGSTAIHKDSSIFQAWATGCEVIRAYINIADTSITYTENETTSNYAFSGSDIFATGEPGVAGNTVSLGDGGEAILSFQHAITNGTGPDFAIFENGFIANIPPYQYFLELAFVEVSSDGINYVRFPSVSLTQDTAQVGTYGQLDPKQIHNLAGKYEINYGTPFDLEDLIDSTVVDIDSIIYIKIIDVIGCIQNEFVNYDSQNNKINDSWPTPFNTCGFDLDAVGVIHVKNNDINELSDIKEDISIFPNPTNGIFFIQGKNIQSIKVMNANGQVIRNLTGFQNLLGLIEVDLSKQAKGIYFVNILSNNKIINKKIIIN